MSSVFTVQQAAHAALAADPLVRAALGDPPRIWDQPPSGAIFPFATYGGQRTTDLLEGLQEHRFTLLVYSRKGGREEAAHALGALRQALHDKALVLGSGALVSMRAVYADILKADGRTFQGLLRMRAVTES